MKHIEILDATIRDGGYINNYDFTLENVKDISLGLERAGVKWVEIGHGYGLGAERTLGKMRATDKEYLEGMQGVLKTSKLGMFANSNITTKEDILLASNYSLDFVRIGFVGFDDPHPLSKALELVEYAKSLNMFVTLNIVKTSMFSTEELKRILKEVEHSGIDALYVVDSSGGMLPEEVSGIVKLFVENSKVAVGYHGHQNLDLGIANSLAAVQAGATFVDGTLLGIGRDTGNAQIDVLSSVLKRAGYEVGINIEELSLVGEKYVQPLLPYPRGVKLDNMLLGYYKLLSHGLPLARKVAKDLGLSEQEVLEKMLVEKIHFESEESIKALFN